MHFGLVGRFGSGLLLNMFKILHRQDLDGWSANRALIVSDYAERSRYALYPISVIQSYGAIASEYLNKAMATPSFLRYRRATHLRMGNAEEYARLLCPLPPPEVQRDIVDMYACASAKSQKDIMAARLASDRAKKELSNYLGITTTNRERFGPLYVIQAHNVHSWSARRVLATEEYSCRTPLSEMRDVLYETGNARVHNGGLMKQMGEAGNVLFIQPGLVGHGNLIEAPKVLDIEAVGSIRGCFVPVGSILIYRIRPENFRYWINRGEFGMPIFAMSSDFFVCRLNDDVVDVDYFELLMNLPFVLKQFQRNASGHLSRISTSSILSIKLPIRELVIQRELASHFLPIVERPAEVARAITKINNGLVDRVERLLFHETK